MLEAADNDVLFTIILEFEGTTSVSQVRATTPAGALQAWRSKIDDEPEVYGLTSKQASGLARGFDIEREQRMGPLTIAGVTNVWCDTILPMGRKSTIALLNIIKTVPPRR